VVGPVALVGSGEYLPVMDGVEQALLAVGARRVGANGSSPARPRFVQLATAAAPEGAGSLARWQALGAAAADRARAEQIVVPVVDRASADDPAHAALIEDAALIYLSGGNPTYLTETLRGTAVWRAILAAWRSGAALAGCSAGAMAIGGRVPHIRQADTPSIAGLALVPGFEVLPHFDVLDRRFPGLVDVRLADLSNPGADGARNDAVRLVGIDEETALVTGLDGPMPAGAWQVPADATWTVMGRRSVWLLDVGDDAGPARHEQPAGSSLVLHALPQSR